MNLSGSSKTGVGSRIGGKMSLRPYLVVFAQSATVSNGCEAKNVPLLFQNEEVCARNAGQL